MKFGNLQEHLLSQVDFTLPADPSFNDEVLKGKRLKNPKVYVGAGTWGDASWAGKVYPQKAPSKAFRQLYPQHFNAVELNATHYNIYAPDVIAKWTEAARGKDFSYCPKFPQSISHHSHFQNTDSLTKAFIESIEAFGANLGPAFLQTSENFPVANKHALFKYLATLPQQHQYFLEVRHPAWFINSATVESWMHVLRQLNIGAVLTDTPARRDAVHMHLPIPKFMLRFVCNGLHSTSFERADAWIERIGKWLGMGLEEAYIFLHPGDDSAIPGLATYWITALNKRCGLQLQPPLPQQSSLF